MQKLMKSWVFTLIVCILLTAFAVLMFLSGFKVGGFKLGNDVLHILAAVALVLYVIFALLPQTWRYRGALQGFVIGEVVILLLTAVAHICMGYVTVPLLSSLQICSVLGLALWLRGVVETVHAYLSNAKEAPDAGRMPLWKLLLYILLSAVGVWQLVSPLLPDKFFVFAIGVASLVIAAIFGVYTANNRKATAEVRAEKKKKRDEKKQAKKQVQQEKANEKNEQKRREAEIRAQVRAAAEQPEALLPAPEKEKTK